MALHMLHEKFIGQGHNQQVVAQRLRWARKWHEDKEDILFSHIPLKDYTVTISYIQQMR